MKFLGAPTFSHVPLLPLRGNTMCTPKAQRGCGTSCTFDATLSSVIQAFHTIGNPILPFYQMCWCWGVGGAGGFSYIGIGPRDAHRPCKYTHSANKWRKLVKEALQNRAALLGYVVLLQLAYRSPPYLAYQTSACMSCRVFICATIDTNICFWHLTTLKVVNL